MYLVVIAWMYVALMMAVAEATSSNGTVPITPPANTTRSAVSTLARRSPPRSDLRVSTRHPPPARGRTAVTSVSGTTRAPRRSASHR